MDTTHESFLADRDIALAWAISDANASPPPGREYVAKVAAGLEARGFTIARIGDPISMDEQIRREFRG